MIELIRAYPAVAPVIGDLLAKNLDWPGADEIAKRLQAMLPAQLHGDDPASQQAHAQMAKMAQIIGELKGELAASKADKSIAQREVEIAAYEAETGRFKAIAPKGAPFDPAEMGQAVMTSLMQIMQSPDILDGMASGAPPEVLAQMLASKMGQPPQGPQPMANGGDGMTPPRPSAPPMAPPIGPGNGL
jgi:hypothetical protein